MNSCVGFTMIWRGSEAQLAGAEDAQRRALAYFTDLHSHTIQMGNTILHLWGRDKVEENTYRLADGSILALIGSPSGNLSWDIIHEKFANQTRHQDFRLPWEGRVIFLHISSDGNRWMLWNDWLGSIPVYYAESPQNRVASTLEPVVVSANHYSADDFYLPGIVTLLSHGNLLSDWTIFKDMKTIQPDSVTSWDEYGMHSMLCGTVQATDERWETSWDDLIDEMHQISKKAILDVLKPESNWTVPLSSGLDSRLIATIGAEEGVNLRTYTWGPKSPTRDVVYSKKISQVLGLPWKNVELGDQYLTEYVKQWADMFGSAMHFHGMYQFPFLNALRSEPIGKIVSGFVGDSLGGYDTLFQTNYHTPNQRTYYALPPTWAFWRAEELKQLFKFPIDDSLEQLADEILRLKNNVSGPWFQRLRFLTLWGRQNHFTYFQSMLSDYWFGVATPYINRTYARFCLSLPRAVLDERRLQLDMMRRYYPKIMSIPGTYALDPAVFTGSFLLKRRLANFLPEQLNRWIFPEFAAARKFLADIASIRSGKRRAIWPIEETRNNLDTWMDINLIDRVYQAALDGDMPSVRKLQSVQAIAYRIASNNNEK